MTSLAGVWISARWSVVARVNMTDGTDAVLKVAHPDKGFAREIHTIARPRGRGYVRLYASDLERHAALLEPLGWSLGATSMPVEQALDVLLATLLQAWLLGFFPLSYYAQFGPLTSPPIVFPGGR